MALEGHLALVEYEADTGDDENGECELEPHLAKIGNRRVFP
jgi:hypothetical protein